MSQRRKDWDALNEIQRNCLMWPEIVTWGQKREVKIRRASKSSKLGLVTVVLQDPQKNHFYHIIKHTEEGFPAHNNVYPHEWIYAVDKKSTLDIKDSESLVDLIKNGNKSVCLSVRVAENTLPKLKNHAKEGIVDLEVTGRDVGFLLAHCYFRGENEQVEDKIMVWSVTKEEMKKQLQRQDELLEVDGEAVLGKKIKEIFQMMWKDCPRTINLKIKGVSGMIRAEESKARLRCAEFKSSERPQKEASEPSGNDQLMVVEETEKSAGRKNENRHEVIATDEIADNELHLKKPCEESVNQNLEQQPDDFHNFNALALDKSRMAILSNKNYGYDSSGNSTPVASRKNNCQLCEKCSSSSRKIFPADKNRWPITMIAPDIYENICKKFDRDILLTKSLFEALNYSHQEVNMIKQEHPNGIGVSRKVLDKWATGYPIKPNDIGALKIIIHEMERGDVLEDITQWEKQEVCPGCGRRLFC